jgi:hypothetical protein
MILAGRSRTTRPDVAAKEADPVVDEWMAYLEAANRPREEVVRESLNTIISLQRDNYLSAQEAEALLRQIAALRVQSYVSEAICHFLDPEVIHGSHRARAGTYWRSVKHFHGEAAR